MAQSGYTPIILFNSGTTGHVPTTLNLAVGELAINYTDGKIFYNNGAGSIVQYNPPSTTLAATSGTINNVTIGGTTPAAGSFTNLSSSGTVSGTGFSNYLASPPTIGGTAPAAGTFTTLGASTGTFTALNSSGTVTLSGTGTYQGNEMGWKTIPISSHNSPYTAVITDSGKFLYFGTAGTFTIPANSSVAFPIGTAITFVNLAGASTIAITSDTMYWMTPGGGTGNRTFATYGMATALKFSATQWCISGTGLS